MGYSAPVTIYPFVAVEHVPALYELYNVALTHGSMFAANHDEQAISSLYKHLDGPTVGFLFINSLTNLGYFLIVAIV